MNAEASEIRPNSNPSNAAAALPAERPSEPTPVVERIRENYLLTPLQRLRQAENCRREVQRTLAGAKQPRPNPA